ncbi:MAG: hypothetical protein ACFFCS_28905, partial [Candidatus Hodarchaeota archaeon]
TYPHLFINREPTFSIPNFLHFSGYPHEWYTMDPGLKIIPDRCIRKDIGLYGNLYKMLVHVARRLSEGFKGYTKDPRSVVSVMGESHFFDHTRSTGEFLRGEKHHPEFSLGRPEVMYDKQRVGVANLDPDVILQTMMGITIEDFLRTYLYQIKNGGFFQPNAAVNDVIRTSVAMAKLVLKDVGVLKQPVYREEKLLMQQGYLDPTQAPPHLTALGRALREVIVLLGFRNMQAFAVTPVRPIGLGLRKPVSELTERDMRLVWHKPSNAPISQWSVGETPSTTQGLPTNSQRMNFCPSCGGKDMHNGLCYDCGAKMCPRCNFLNTVGQDSCKKCGNKFF